MVLPSTWIERVANSTPMVDLDSRLNSFRVNRDSRLDLPTPESPIRTTVAAHAERTRNAPQRSASSASAPRQGRGQHTWQRRPHSNSAARSMHTWQHPHPRRPFTAASPVRPPALQERPRTLEQKVVLLVFTHPRRRMTASTASSSVTKHATYRAHAPQNASPHGAAFSRSSGERGPSLCPSLCPLPTRSLNAHAHSQSSPSSMPSARSTTPRTSSPPTIHPRGSAPPAPPPAPSARRVRTPRAPARPRMAAYRRRRGRTATRMGGGAAGGIKTTVRNGFFFGRSKKSVFSVPREYSAFRATSRLLLIAARDFVGIRAGLLLKNALFERGNRAHAPGRVPAVIPHFPRRACDIISFGLTREHHRKDRRSHD